MYKIKLCKEFQEHLVSDYDLIEKKDEIFQKELTVLVFIPLSFAFNLGTELFTLS
jgi:alkyl hydroperoxide reductase subunit AhpC